MRKSTAFLGVVTMALASAAATGAQLVPAGAATADPAADPAGTRVEKAPRAAAAHPGATHVTDGQEPARWTR